jgi:hypothetical protein
MKCTSFLRFHTHIIKYDLKETVYYGRLKNKDSLLQIDVNRLTNVEDVINTNLPSFERSSYQIEVFWIVTSRIVLCVTTQ